STIAFRAASQVGSAAAVTVLTVPVPAGVLPGDVMIAFILMDAGGLIVDPPGWTYVDQTASAAPTTLRTVMRVATAGEPVSYDWSLPTARAAGSIVAYSGV